MGRVKSLAIKRATKTLIGQNTLFTNDFNKNKEILKNYKLPDKSTRNKIAGYITRLKKTAGVQRAGQTKEQPL